ncbi:MAG: PDZ domain-containing protein, partial [Burkholderiales bacterium]|nr:PDZ domain-containing protein [Burkholderiales bacterium]
LSKAGLALGGWQLTLQPQAEWRQMFDDAWRMHRDYLFDPKLRGLDWQQIHDKYAAFLPQVRDKYELNDLLAIMMSELGTLHSQIAPGEVRKFESNRTPAFLGAALERVANGYKIAHIYRHDNELPNEASPLAQGGQDFHDGDIIIHVNNRPVAEVADIAQLLENQVGQQVLLHYLRGQQHKSAIVQPVNADRNVALRYTDWEWSRQQQVEQASQGKIGYLHLRAMTTPDLNVFVREFYAQINREGLIIDVRRNSGGNIDSWIIEKLLRRTWGFWQSRDGTQETHPQQSFRGHLVVLADELTYSDGETFAAATKALGLGPVIGKRTAGAGVWLSDDNALLDKGRARAAENAQFLIADGRWIIEGVGVAPDIEVANLPHASFEGKDAQLEAAIQWLQEKRKQAPIPALKAQPLPVKNP